MAIKKVCTKERLFVRKKAVFEDSEERHVQKKFLCVKKVALSEVRKVSANEFI